MSDKTESGKEWTLWTSIEPEYSWWRGEFTALNPVRTREEAEAQTEDEVGDGIDARHVYRIVVQKVKRQGADDDGGER